MDDSGEYFFINFIKLEFSEHPLRCSMDLVDLRARSTFLIDLEFTGLGLLAGKSGSGTVSLDLKMHKALPNISEEDYLVH